MPMDVSQEREKNVYYAGKKVDKGRIKVLEKGGDQSTVAALAPERPSLEMESKQ